MIAWVRVAVLAAAVMVGCAGGVRDTAPERVKIVAVNLVSSDGKGWVHTGPVFSVGAERKNGEQVWFISVHKMVVGMEACLVYNEMAGGWRTSPCMDAPLGAEDSGGSLSESRGFNSPSVVEAR